MVCLIVGPVGDVYSEIRKLFVEFIFQIESANETVSEAFKLSLQLLKLSSHELKYSLV